jgi:hypothetical protein
MTRHLLVAATLAVLAASAAQAQTGVFVGAHITGASLTYKDAAQDLDFGSGVGWHAGLTLGRSLGVLVNYDQITLGSSGGDTDLEQWDLLGRLHLVGVGPAQAYLTAGVTGRTSISRFFDGSAGDFDFRGVNPTAGITGQVMLTSRLALDGGVMWTFGRFHETRGYNESRVEATGSRVFVAASYYLFGGR